MRAVSCTEYGSPEVLHMRQVPKPVPGDGELLVKVHATTVSAADWRMRKAEPNLARLYNGLFRPKKVTILGMEFAGVVEGLGSCARLFREGDPVFGYTGFRFGCYADYLCLPERGRPPREGLVTQKPPAVSYEEAAAIPLGGLAALTMLKKGAVERGRNVLINGASGSVGTYAVQIARYFGADVTAVCGPTNVELVRSLGATKTIDYTRADFTEAGETYDLIFDAVGKMVSGIAAPRCRRVLNPGGAYVSVEMDRRDRVEDLALLAELVESGKIKPVIDRRYTLERLPEAHAYVEKGHKKGNVIVWVAGAEGA